MIRQCQSGPHVVAGGLDWAHERVRAFHEAFGHPVGLRPHPLDGPRATVRAAWMREEVDEFELAASTVDQADAMIDLIYFALGTLVEMGVPAEPLFEIVHRANMSKRAADGVVVRAPDGKVEKPIGWVSPETQLSEWLVAQYAGHRFVSAAEISSAAAVLAMAADAVRLTGYSGQDFEAVLPGTTPDGSEDRAIGGGTLNRYLSRKDLPLDDGYLHHDTLDEATFGAALQESVAQCAGVALGCDASVLYRGRSAGARFVLVADVGRSNLMVVDPDPAAGGIHEASLDDALAAVRRREDGIHRIRRRST